MGNFELLMLVSSFLLIALLVKKKTQLNNTTVHIAYKRTEKVTFPYYFFFVNKVLFQ